MVTGRIIFSHTIIQKYLDKKYGSIAIAKTTISHYRTKEILATTTDDNYNVGDVHTKYYGEQNYVNWKIQEHKTKLVLTPAEWICKYTSSFEENVTLNKMYSDKFKTEYMILGDVYKYIKVVHFTGPGKTIHEHNETFIKEMWR